MIKKVKHMVWLIVLSMILSTLNLFVHAEELQKVSFTLSVEDRVDQILESVLWKYDAEMFEEQLAEVEVHNYRYDDAEYMTRGDAAVAVLRVVGMTDDAATFNVPLFYMSDFHEAGLNGSYYKGLYLATACGDGIISERVYKPNEFCTIENILRIIACCIQVEDNDDYVEIIRKNNLCSEDVLERTNEFITIREMRNILINLYGVAGEWFYNNIHSYAEIHGIDLSHSQTYYERYQKATNYNIYSVFVNGYEIQCAEAENGEPLVALSDLSEIYNISLTWDNGIIGVSDTNGNEYVFRLDEFITNWREGCDKTIYVRNLIYDEKGWRIWSDETEYNCGQYEMINDRVFVYPKAYKYFLQYMNLPMKFLYFEYYF